MNELILKVESKVISANAAEWEAEQKAFLAGLTSEFKTDEDFAKAETELKEIEAREKAAKAALDAVVNGSKDVEALIKNVDAIIEDLRQARLSHSKIIKSEKEARIKAIVDDAVDLVKTAYNADEMFVKPLQASMPFNGLVERLHNATKRKRTIDSVQKAVNTEANACTAEIITELARLQGRYDELPMKEYKHLFNDALDLIVSNDALKPIVDERIKAEQARIAEAEAKAKVEVAKPVEPAQPETTTKPITEQPEATLVKPAQPNEPLGKYAIIVDGATLSQIKRIAQQLKGQFKSVQLKKLEK